VQEAIAQAPQGHPMRNVQPIRDPSDDIIMLLIKTNQWNLASREQNIPVDSLVELQNMSADLLETLKQVLPERTGTTDHNGVLKGWCIEKAHSILHLSRTLLLFGNLELTSAQGPERAHINLVKRPAALSNRKQMMLCIMNYHAQEIKINILKQRGVNVVELERIGIPQTVGDAVIERVKVKSQCESLPCELGLRYPCLAAAKAKDQYHIRAKVM
jgi:hypothetical protein